MNCILNLSQGQWSLTSAHYLTGLNMLRWTLRTKLQELNLIKMYLKLFCHNHHNKRPNKSNSDHWSLSDILKENNVNAPWHKCSLVSGHEHHGYNSFKNILLVGLKGPLWVQVFGLTVFLWLGSPIGARTCLVHLFEIFWLIFLKPFSEPLCPV